MMKTFELVYKNRLSNKWRFPMRIETIGVLGLPIIREGDDLSTLIFTATSAQGTPLKNGDIVVLSHVIVSRAEGRTINLKEVKPSKASLNFAVFVEKDPRLVEVVLNDSRAIRRMAPGILITETKQGFVCANSGVDKSNVPGEDIVALLPEDPDESATIFRNRIKELYGIDIAVIICDTHGRCHRDGEVNVAVGASGLNVIRDRRGEKDLFGYELMVKRTAIADELAAAAELVIGQADEGIPAAIIRGYKYDYSETSSAKKLVRPREMDLFI
jgi:coenzyme F420-0:L-glutamate ligase/coenzyme F420-1:gamma-L-glutamate ligase